MTELALGTVTDASDPRRRRLRRQPGVRERVDRASAGPRSRAAPPRRGSRATRSSARAPARSPTWRSGRRRGRAARRRGRRRRHGLRGRQRPHARGRGGPTSSSRSSRAAPARTSCARSRSRANLDRALAIAGTARCATIDVGPRPLPRLGAARGGGVVRELRRRRDQRRDRPARERDLEGARRADLVLLGHASPSSRAGSRAPMTGAGGRRAALGPDARGARDERPSTPGAGCASTPDASPDDGLLDAMLIGDVNEADFVANAPEDVPRDAHVATRRSRSLRGARVDDRGRRSPPGHARRRAAGHDADHVRRRAEGAAPSGSGLSGGLLRRRRASWRRGLPLRASRPRLLRRRLRLLARAARLRLLGGRLRLPSSRAARRFSSRSRWPAQVLDLVRGGEADLRERLPRLLVDLALRGHRARRARRSRAGCGPSSSMSFVTASSPRVRSLVSTLVIASCSRSRPYGSPWLRLLDNTHGAGERSVLPDGAGAVRRRRRSGTPPSRAAPAGEERRDDRDGDEVPAAAARNARAPSRQASTIAPAAVEARRRRARAARA